MKFMLVNAASSIDLFVICRREEELDEDGRAVMNVFLYLTDPPADDEHQSSFFPAASNAVIDVEDTEKIMVNIFPPDGADIEKKEGLVEEDGEKMPAFRIVRITFDSTGN